MGIKDITRQNRYFKMDIEGWSMRLSQRRASNCNVKNWIIEVHPRKDHRALEIQKMLLQNGFKIEINKDKTSVGRGLVLLKLC